MSETTEFIRVQDHPDLPYEIHNYTEKCVYARAWNDETLNARGLIKHKETGEVVARGMKKFFNYGEPDAPEFKMNDRVWVCDKADGSLGIIYPDGTGGWAVATRGSFTSDQAVHATALLNSSPEALWFAQNQRAGHNLVVEIVYPENRIVLDYGDRDELILLGAVEHESGRFIPMWHDQFGLWPWSVAQGFGEMTYADALALPDRENAEGIVLTRAHDGAMVKMKQEDYLRLHRIISNLSERAIWEVLAEGGDIDEYIMALPDEFQEWADDVTNRLEDDHEARSVYLSGVFYDVVLRLDHYHGLGWSRKDFALEVSKSVDDLDKWAMFAILDEKDIRPKVWQELKPAATKPFQREEEEE